MLLKVCHFWIASAQGASSLELFFFSCVPEILSQEPQVALDLLFWKGTWTVGVFSPEELGLVIVPALQKESCWAKILGTFLVPALNVTLFFPLNQEVQWSPAPLAPHAELFSAFWHSSLSFFISLALFSFIPPRPMSSGNFSPAGAERRLLLCRSPAERQRFRELSDVWEKQKQ